MMERFEKANKERLYRVLTSIIFLNVLTKVLSMQKKQETQSTVFIGHYFSFFFFVSFSELLLLASRRQPWSDERTNKSLQRNKPQRITVRNEEDEHANPHRLHTASSDNRTGLGRVHPRSSVAYHHRSMATYWCHWPYCRYWRGSSSRSSRPARTTRLRRINRSFFHRTRKAAWAKAQAAFFWSIPNIHKAHIAWCTG